VKICAGSFQVWCFCYGLLALSSDLVAQKEEKIVSSSPSGLSALSEIKLGLISFHEITENFKAILDTINKRFPNRFGYFCIGSGWFQLGEERGEVGWSQTIKKIKSFIENSLNESLC